MIPLIAQLALWGLLGWVKLSASPPAAHPGFTDTVIGMAFVLWAFTLPLQFRRRHD